MKKILLVFGTRPEAIKMAPVYHRLKSYHPELRPVVCVTAQHRQMLDQVLKIFGIVPDYDLDVMRPDQDLFDITANVLSGLKGVLTKERPDVVLVQGDTTTAFVGGLAAYYLKIPIVHIEAGLRTQDKYSPFPEEKNRHLLSTLADYHFAPTQWSRDNLVREAVPDNRIWVTGNTVIDALHYIVKLQRKEEVRNALADYFLKTWKLSLSGTGEKVVLVTGHRRENFGEGFRDICGALRDLALLRKDIVIVYPVHLNPNVQKPVREILADVPNIHLIEPIEYEPFIYLMSSAYLVLTDSGGVQEEAPSLGKPVLVMRDTTERPEGVSAGTVKIVGTDRRKIGQEALRLIDDPEAYEAMARAANPYGDGRAAERICDVLDEQLANPG